jgi:VWFA-related protein
VQPTMRIRRQPARPRPHRAAMRLSAPLLVLLLCLLPARAADEGESVLHAGVAEVRVAFAVSDARGRPVHTLESADVAVVDNGWIIRNFRSFHPEAEVPLDLVLLLDASDSVQSQLAGEIADAKSFLAAASLSAGDRVSILVFGGIEPRLLCLSNCQKLEAPPNWKQLRANGLTPLYDALVQAAEILRLNRDPQTRPAMVLFSDGHDTISQHTLREALDETESLAAPLFTLAVCQDGCERNPGNAVLAQLSGETGGLAFASGQNVSKVLRRVLEDLHSGYVLTYEPLEQLHGRHSLSLQPTRNPALRFRARRVYDDTTDKN